uniref:Uncharacterized protein n=1 Tax=Onchocerca volvulus TaxID=6282 RepID=A0A8R1XZ31_ONCVO
MRTELPAQLKPVAGRAVYSHMVVSSSAVPSPALCSRPQNSITPDHYPMVPLGPNGGPLSNHAGSASSGMPFRGQFINHAIQMGLAPHVSDGEKWDGEKGGQNHDAQFWQKYWKFIFEALRTEVLHLLGGMILANQNSCIQGLTRN